MAAHIVPWGVFNCGVPFMNLHEGVAVTEMETRAGPAARNASSPAADALMRAWT